ncbi:MAG: histidine kinase [Bacteroidota bacterium]
MIALAGNGGKRFRKLQARTVFLFLCLMLLCTGFRAQQQTRIKKVYEYRETSQENVFPINAKKLLQQLPQDPLSKNFKIEDGLISNESHCVISDSKGFIWIATDGGICRYDGTKFVRFSIAEGLPERMITKLHEDKKGRIWFITISSMIGYIENDQIRVLKHKFKEGVLKFKTDDFAHSLYVDEGDTLWVGTIHSGMLYKSAYPYTSQPIARRMKSDFVVEFNRKGDYIYGTYQMFCASHLLKSCTVDITLTYMQKWKNKTRSFHSLQDVEAGYRTHKIIKTGTDEFIACSKSGMYSIRKGKFKLEMQLSIINIFLDKENRLWVLTANQGVYMFPDYRHLNNWKFYYRDQYFTSMTTDIEGGTWMTTLYNGVKYVPDFDFLTLLKEGKQIENIVSYKDKVLVNEKLGNLLMFDKNDSITRFDLELFYYSPYIDNELIFCYLVNRPGLYKVKYVSVHNNKKVIRKRNFNNPMHIKKVVRYKGNDYLMNMTRIHMYDNRRQQMIPLTLTHSRINNFVIARDTIWLATNNGLFSFDLASKKWVSNAFMRKHLNFRIDDIVETDNGFWMCVFGKGVLHYNKKERLVLFDEKKGLVSNYVRKLYLGPKNKLWISTNEGLSYINNENSRQVINYQYLEGYGIGQINDLLRLRGDLYLATSNGLYKFPVKRLDKQNKTSPIYITLARSKYVKKLSNNAELEYGDDKITINFLTLNYTNARKAEYFYMIKGFDDIWHKTGNSSVSLNKLPPGNYSFIIKNDSNSHATFNFSIRYPFWQKWWFICLMGLALVLSVYLLINHRTKMIKAEEREKNNIQVQIAGLQANVIRAQMNPHFMFNALNSIQGFILANENKQANFYLGKFSSLMRKVIQISRHDFVTVKEELRLLQDYVEIERMRCAYSFQYVINISNKESLGVRIPAMVIQPFIENAINHGLTPLEGREGKLEINFDMHEKNIICTITDNGIGRAKAQEIKQKKIRYHQSASIKLTENRIDLYNKLYKAESKISIEDLYDEEQQPAGTQVELIIPIIR